MEDPAPNNGEQDAGNQKCSFSLLLSLAPPRKPQKIFPVTAQEGRPSDTAVDQWRLMCAAEVDRGTSRWAIREQGLADPLQSDVHDLKNPSMITLLVTWLVIEQGSSQKVRRGYGIWQSTIRAQRFGGWPHEVPILLPWGQTPVSVLFNIPCGLVLENKASLLGVPSEARRPPAVAACS